MISLIIETSTERGLVAIAQENHFLFQQELPYGTKNSTHLLPTIQEAFSQTSLKPNQLDYIVVGIGPGSYTGIRVGAMAAKSIAFACHKPLVGVCTLKGFVPKQDGKFAAIIDAKISGAYLLVGNKKNDVVEYLSEPIVCPLNEIMAHLNNISTLVTPNSQRLKPLLEQIYPDSQWSWEEIAPSPTQLKITGENAFRSGKYSLDGHLELLYLRAENKL